MKRYLYAWLILLGVTAPGVALDSSNNQQSDVWEQFYQALSLPQNGDADGDGWTNAAESTAGTNPLNGLSFPNTDFRFEAGLPVISWQGKLGKNYRLLASDDLSTFTPLGDAMAGASAIMELTLPEANGSEFFRIQISDVDSDGDGLNDWEENTLGLDPKKVRTERYSQTDSQNVATALSAVSSITASVYDDSCSERWPDPAVLVLRRSGGIKALTVNFSLTGSAVRNMDYQASLAGNTASFALGQREVTIDVVPIADSDHGEAAEAVTLTALAGAGYTLGSVTTASAMILNETPTSGPSAKAAARFLLQAAFGPDQDSAADIDQIPENIEELMAMGYEAWIDDQLTRPVGTLRPMVQWQNAQPSSAQIYNDRKQNAWWGRAMGLPKLRPDAATSQLPDPLRQRVAFALSQIFVISDRMEDLAVDPEGMAAYYDMLLGHSFGNFENLLRDVSVHPCMGIYLSHLGNRKADVVARTFPDENYAREVMQLFSIGLWMLQPDGTRVLSNGTNLGPSGETIPLNQPIPTYDNSTITQFARVFTGLAFGGTNVNFGLYPRDFTVPMKGWDAEHDLAPKTLLLGTTTPQRVASPGNTGTATMADVNAAISNLFNHPNVGPFLGRQLIQRLVTSNPSPAYVARVTAAFNAAPRGDLGRTVKAILLDPEARDPVMIADPTFGKLREPFLKTVNLARAFNASAPNGWYYLDAFTLDHVEEPLKAPSVFNFYLPSYSPPGPIAAAGLVAPEFQIINASSGVMAANYYWNQITAGLHRWGVGLASQNVTLNLDQEMLLNVPASAVNDPYPSTPALDPDPLIRRLDLVLTGGTLTPRSFQIIREALIRIGPNSQWDWPRSRLKLAIYLIVNSPEFAVQR
ncbi:MAG: DUF1800 family protein [Verrucomicrobia bacterium]|nr:MAG: DUF1800 family protein [Verrucomicrobiota bacterium]